MSVNGSGAAITGINTLTTIGNMTHGGLTFTSGTDIDQRKLISVNATITAGSYITITTSNAHLVTGSYAVQVLVDNGPGGGIWGETFSGLMSWYDGVCNDQNEASYVTLHNMGHAINGRILTLRTRRPSVNVASVLEFTLNFSQTNYTYNWYFRKIMAELPVSEPVTFSVSGSNMDLTNVASLTVSNNITHGGLTMTSGTGIDQITLVQVSTTLTANIPVTILSGSTLPTGTYFVQVFINTNVNGGIWYETYSGLMSWFGDGNSNNSNASTVIPLHNCGHAENTRVVTLRTIRPSSNPPRLEFFINIDQGFFQYNWYFRNFLDKL